jgi:hypothetical protein
MNVDVSGHIGESIATDHKHTPELTMHWVDVQTNPAANEATGGSRIVPCSSARRDQLAAVWSEQDAGVVESLS